VNRLENGVLRNCDIPDHAFGVDDISTAQSVAGMTLQRVAAYQ
jgi:hypothetical protein